ncbi:hypothetical protein BV898_19448 [Hypsibius exemplaris]|uniref:Uncharacterized protein n=1 Tax=Hypsibius exemplaris TaxID=2072580 RepID=A0A9X6NLH6_HYPEX|nr:hypothetical protein BV898_19448 [Hypsibius exemplaris]
MRSVNVRAGSRIFNVFQTGRPREKAREAATGKTPHRSKTSRAREARRMRGENYGRPKHAENKDGWILPSLYSQCSWQKQTNRRGRRNYRSIAGEKSAKISTPVGGRSIPCVLQHRILSAQWLAQPSPLTALPHIVDCRPTSRLPLRLSFYHGFSKTSDRNDRISPHNPHVATINAEKFTACISTLSLIQSIPGSTHPVEVLLSWTDSCGPNLLPAGQAGCLRRKRKG